MLRTRKLDNEPQIACCLMLVGEIQAHEDAAQAIGLFGAAEKLLHSLDAAIEPSWSLVRRQPPAVRTRLGEEAFALAWEEGKTVSLDRAVDAAMGGG